MFGFGSNEKVEVSPMEKYQEAREAIKKNIEKEIRELANLKYKAGNYSSEQDSQVSMETDEIVENINEIIDTKFPDYK